MIMQPLLAMDDCPYDRSHALLEQVPNKAWLLFMARPRLVSYHEVCKYIVYGVNAGVNNLGGCMCIVPWWRRGFSISLGIFYPHVDNFEYIFHCFNVRL
jgi:hypothetical protein